MRAGFLARYAEDEGASSRVRVYQFLEPLRGLGIDARVLPRPSRQRPGSEWTYVPRAMTMARWSDVVVLQKPNQRPALINALMTLNQRIIVDFDDAVWAPPNGPVDGGSAGPYLELERRLLHAIGRAGWVTTGNSYLAQWAADRCPDARITVINESFDMSATHLLKEASSSGPVVIGWMGSPGNIIDLGPVLPVLRNLVDGASVRFRVISGRRPALDGLEWEFEQWDQDREVQALLAFDIGIMPLLDNERSRGRCGFKAIQYMAAGLPVVASRVGGALDVVDHGVTGYLAQTDAEWTTALETLMGNVALRAEMGANGRRRAEREFSLDTNLARMVEVMRSRADGSRHRATGS